MVKNLIKAITKGSIKKANDKLPKPGRKKSTTVTFEDIEKRAYHKWLGKGCRVGKDLEDWLEAEQELEAEENPDEY